jgi:hypothetical protein
VFGYKLERRRRIHNPAVHNTASTNVPGSGTSIFVPLNVKMSPPPESLKFTSARMSVHGPPAIVAIGPPLNGPTTPVLPTSGGVVVGIWSNPTFFQEDWLLSESV